MMQDKPDITAQTTVAELLKHYPDLEGILIEQAPMFEKIQSPLLRKTVAKVATLKKAAVMAGIPVERLVDTLRDAAGLAQLASSCSDESGAEASGGELSTDEPVWVSTGKVAKKIDVDGMLAEGVHPLKLVMKLLEELESGGLIKIESSFPPIPLADAATQKGYLAWTGVRADGQYETFFGSPKAE